MQTQDTLYRFTIDGTEYNTTDATLTPDQLRLMAQLPSTRLILLVTPAGQVREIAKDEMVHLNSPHIETFISRDPKPAQDQQHYRFEVDGELYETLSATVSGQDIKILAGLVPSITLYFKQRGQVEPIGDQQLINLSVAGTEQFTTQGRPKTTYVTVTAVYTTTARSKTFQAQPTDSLQTVISEAYTRLGETPRDSDSLLTGTTTRTDLRPFLHDTMQTLLSRGFIAPLPHLTLHIDIDPAAGGA